MTTAEIPVSGFRECDVRGQLESDITSELAYRIGRAIGTLASEDKAIIAGDFRQSTPQLKADLRRGLIDCGLHVVDIGQISTPGYYFARHHLGFKVGIMVTASHSPVDWNGFKVTLGDLPVTPADMEAIRDLALSGEFKSGEGSFEERDAIGDYTDWLAERFASLSDNMPKAIFDCGNGATSAIIHPVMEKLKLNSELLFAEPDGAFPNRSPDIAKKSDLAILEETIKEHGADIGFGFDGDGDRVGVIDEKGQRVTADALTAWLGREMVKQSPGSAVIYDLKLSRSVSQTVEEVGGIAIPQKSGHTFIKTLMIEKDAVIGGELSGHLFYRELHGGDDGLYSALLISELLAASDKPLSEIIAEIPVYVSSPDLRIRYTEPYAPILDKALAHAQKDAVNIIHIDGVRAEFEHGWALIRGSVTEPALTLRFEGETRDDMLKVAEHFLSGLDEIRDAVWEKVLKS